MLTLQEGGFQIGPHRLLEPCTIHFRPGTLYALLGANGSGKSTLLKLLAGSLKTTEGKVLYEERPLSAFSRREVAQKISCLPQSSMQSSSLVMDLQVLDWVMMGCYPFQNPAISARSRALEALYKVGLQPSASQLLHTLSQGQRQKIALARILVTNPQVYLLDEPTAHLDIYQREWVWQFLHSAASEGKLVILATHDVDMAKQYANEALLIRQGRLIAQGPCTELLSAYQIQSLYHSSSPF